MTVGATRTHRRRRALAAGLLAAGLAIVAAAAIVLIRSGDERRFAPAAGSGDDRYDPLAFRDDRRAAFERRAAAGLAHVLYAKSPGGAVASARRTARWRPSIERAARTGGVDPDLLEAIVLLESAGRPEVIAGGDPEGAAGLTQIVAGTAVDLLGMRVDVRRTRKLTRRITAAEAAGDTTGAARLRARRRRVDARFDPRRALAGSVRYLTLARERFGRDDLALAAYHMGIGNLETALRAYAGADADEPLARLVADRELSYARLYFDSTPLLHVRAYATLAGLGDDSATYLWRLLAARAIMGLFRERPRELRRLAALHVASDSAERVLHPPGVTGLADAASLERAARAGRLVDPPGALESLGLVFGRPSGRRRTLRPEALSAALYIGAGSAAIAGERPLVVSRAATAAGEAAGDELHATGYAFDIARRYRSHRQAHAFEFMLGRLQALDLIAWRRDRSRIHIVVSADADELLPPPNQLAEDAEP
jgi:soluble lytic murein transglycosylase-like protein